MNTKSKIFSTRDVSKVVITRLLPTYFPLTVELFLILYPILFGFGLLFSSTLLWRTGPSSPLLLLSVFKHPLRPLHGVHKTDGWIPCVRFRCQRYTRSRSGPYRSIPFGTLVSPRWWEVVRGPSSIFRVTPTLQRREWQYLCSWRFLLKLILLYQGWLLWLSRNYLFEFYRWRLG